MSYEDLFIHSIPQNKLIHKVGLPSTQYLEAFDPVSRKFVDGIIQKRIDGSWGYVWSDIEIENR